MALPLFPLNPVEQDTLNTVNLHVTAGLTGPDNLVDPGFQFTGKYELLVKHPFVVRGAAEYGYNPIGDRDLPDGSIHAMNLALEGLYYRGTDHMTGFIGAGVVLYKGFVSLDSDAADSLFQTSQVTDVDIKSKIGWRFLLGLRFSKVFSVEVALSEIRPTLIETQQIGADQFKETSTGYRLHTVRLTLGYVFSLSP
jgi:opacity protein-like surface antigen